MYDVDPQEMKERARTRDGLKKEQGNAVTAQYNL